MSLAKCNTKQTALAPSWLKHLSLTKPSHFVSYDRFVLGPSLVFGGGPVGIGFSTHISYCISYRRILYCWKLTSDFPAQMLGSHSQEESIDSVYRKVLKYDLVFLNVLLG